MSDYIPFEVFATCGLLLMIYLTARGADKDRCKD